MRPLIVLLPLALILVAGCRKQEATAPQAPAGPDAVAVASPAGATKEPFVVDRSHKGEDVPAKPFVDLAGAPATLTGFRGKPLLVNFWATWCAPCVAELPALDRMAAARAGAITVVTINEDSKGVAVAKPFLAKHGIRAVKSFADQGFGVMVATQADNMPATILYGADGKERWRILGAVDWQGAEAAKLLAEAS